jgi:6-phosphogluconolactonase
MPEIIVLDNLSDLHNAAAEEIARQSLAVVAEGRDFTIVLSGGSTPRGIYMRMAEVDLREQLPWQSMQFFWGDERHVPPDHTDSNYRLAWESMLAHVPVPAENIHRIQSDLADPAQAAERYQDTLFQYFKFGPGDMPRFDLILLGMGPDGHTASLFPGTRALGVSDRTVVANWVGKFATWRITMTAALINHASKIIVLIAGENKAPVLRAVLEGPLEPDQLPIQLIKPQSGSLVWMADRAAAAELTV